MSEKEIRVVLVDDHQVVVAGLRATIEAQPDMIVIGQANTMAEGQMVIDDLKPDVVLLDLHLPDGDGIQLTRAILGVNPKLTVILLTVAPSPTYVSRAVEAGVRGYLLKTTAPEVIAGSIRLCRLGVAVLTAGVLRESVLVSAGPTSPDVRARLTPRELEVLRLVALGRRNAEISEQLGLAQVTVKKYVQSVIQKLGVQDRTQAALSALQLGLAELPETGTPSKGV